MSSWRLVPSLFRLGLSPEEEKTFEADIEVRMRSNFYFRTMVPDRLLGDKDYLFAVAQHYGCPTRMLDWTRSPLHAAYFAASDALRLRQADDLSVFAIADIANVAVHASGTVLVTPASAANENIAAQLGILCRHEWTCRDYWHDDYEHVTATTPVVTDAPSSRFIRFDLPVDHASELLAEVARRGVNGATAFPGNHGVVRDAADFARQSPRWRP